MDYNHLWLNKQYEKAVYKEPFEVDYKNVIQFIKHIFKYFPILCLFMDKKGLLYGKWMSNSDVNESFGITP